MRILRLCAAAAMATTAVWLSGTQWVAQTRFPPLDLAVSPQITAKDGRLLRAFTVEDGRWRLPVELKDVDPGYIRQLIAFEDKRFYRHAGVDLVAGLRAVGQALWHQEVVSGASTLTMQVARLLEDAPTGRWSSKVRQIRLALALENRLTKAQILELYLLRAPMGGNVEGLRAATLSYFGKEPTRLTPAQAALLVALPQSPERRRPDRFADVAQSARNAVLNRMARQGILTPDSVRAAKREPVPNQRAAFPHYAAHLSQRLLTQAPAGTPVIETTLDLNVQRALERRLRDAVQTWPQPINAAAIVANHQSGAIIAQAGSASATDAEREGAIDMTSAWRSPGSALKPLIFGMAFEDGLAHPETVIHDTPMQFGGYAPQNFDGQYFGPMSLRKALQSSRNVPAIALLSDVGPARLMARMRRGGIAGRLPGTAPPGLAIGLGGLGMRLQDLAALYAGIANQGVVPGLSATDVAGPGRRVLSPRAAWYVADVLSGTPPPPGSPLDVLAYKTGTSYGHRDAWSVGFDGQYVVAIWVGRADGAAMPGALARDLAAPLMFDVHALLAARPTPLALPPDDALTLSRAELPTALQHYRKTAPRDAVGPEILYPPTAARLALDSDALMALKVGQGRAPYTWLINGAPVEVASYDPLALVKSPGPGFARISVVDAEGRSQFVDVEILP